MAVALEGRAAWARVVELGEHKAMAAVKIHPSAVVGDGVRLGDGVVVGPGAVLMGPLSLGDGVWVGAGAVLGAPPEVTGARMNLAWDGDLDHAGVEIGTDVVVREHVVVHQGTHRPTRVGRGTWLLNRSYVAHDVQIGDGVVVSSGVAIGGHVVIGARANLGMNTTVHQRRVVGPGAMVGMGTAVSRDVPPYALVHGSPLRLHGVNAYVLARAGLDTTLTEELRALYLGAADLATLPVRPGLSGIADDLAWWNGLDGLRPVRVAADVLVP